MVGERVRRVVEVDEGVADGVAERVVEGAATLVPDSAFEEGDGGGRGGA